MKIWVHFISFNFESWRKQCGFTFLILCSVAQILAHCHVTRTHENPEPSQSLQRWKRWPYLHWMASKCKSDRTLFSPTFKIGGNNLAPFLILCSVAHILAHWQFTRTRENQEPSWIENMAISALVGLKMQIWLHFIFFYFWSLRS